MTETSTPRLTDVRDMFVAHRTFRRECRLIPQLVRGVVAGDTARAAVVGGPARLVLKGLHLHHTSEDELLWPKLLERARPEAELVHRMAAQHERVEHYTERLTAALDRWEAEARPAVTEEVASTFDALREALFEHLEEEERQILPLAARHVSQEEWDQIGEHGIATMSKSELPIMFGAVLEEATPEEAAELLAKLPLPVRVLARVVLLPKYRRYIRKVRTGA
jgi:DUF438 domain-containing protein